MHRKWFVHILFWFSYFLLEILSNYFHYPPDQFHRLILDIFEYLPFVVVTTYWTYYAIVPRFINKGNKPLLFLEVIAVLMFIYLGRYLWAFYDFNLDEKDVVFIPWSKVIKNTIKDISMVTLASCLLFIRDWWKQQGVIANLRKTNAEQRLAIMMQQLQPHFLFNTINNIYSLIRKEPLKGAESLLLLSDVLEYLLHTEIREKVSLKEELKAANKYVSLHRLKYGDRLEFSTLLENTDHLKIPPVLIISLMENAFKHGGLLEDKFLLKLSCVKTGKEVHLSLSNSFTASTKTKQRSHNGNIILSNLMTLHYGKHFEMKTTLENNMYCTQINWKNEV